MQKFDLSLWLQDKSRKVVTRNGKPVRIVCWDKLGDYPIIGCIKYSDDYEDLESYNSNGFKYSFEREDQNDLFFADEKEELTEFEKKISDLINYHHSDSVGKLKCVVKEEAKILLDLARKEICLTCKEYSRGYQEGLKLGREASLKDLPRWKKAKDEHKRLFDERGALAFIKGATFALQNQWISVDEGLPEVDKNFKLSDKCFIARKGKFGCPDWFGDGYYDKDMGWVNHGKRISNITHWMPIPELKGGEE